MSVSHNLLMKFNRPPPATFLDLQSANPDLRADARMRDFEYDIYAKILLNKPSTVLLLIGTGHAAGLMNSSKSVSVEPQITAGYGQIPSPSTRQTLAAIMRLTSPQWDDR